MDKNAIRQKLTDPAVNAVGWEQVPPHGLARTNTNQNERTELHKTIWKIANDLRGSVDGWEFKAYVLGSIFYRFISENICDYIQQLMAEAGQPDFDYTAISDDMAERIRQKMVEEKGYFILPSQLFQNVVKNADQDENLNERLNSIFRSIEASAVGTPSEDDLRGLFSDFAVDSQALGSTVIKRNQLLAKVLKTVAQMNLGSRYNDTDNDTFGDTYEFLMQMYASEAGKSGGEFFTPQQVSELLARLASWHNPNIQNEILWSGGEPHDVQPLPYQYVPAQRELRQLRHPSGGHAAEAPAHAGCPV